MATFSVGAALREERTRQELSLSEIAQETRISQRYLEAIEAEEFERLPGLVFTRNFVRQYAHALKLDPAPMLSALPQINLDTAPMPDPPPKPRRSRWNVRLSSGFASAAWFLVAVGASAAAYVHFNRPLPSTETVRPIETHQAVAAPKAAPVAEATPAPPPPVAPAAEQASSTSPIQVLVTAKERSWVQVTADGKTTFVGTLNPSDTRSIGASELVKLVTGNAGGLEVSLNGRSLEPLGPSGQVRTVRLTAEGLQFVLKTPPQPVPDPL